MSDESWTGEQAGRFDAAEELEIASRRADGSWRRWTPIWVVTVGDEVYVRTWHRRDTGWFGDVVRTPQARVRVPGLDAAVTVDDIGAADAELRSRIDDAYSRKYGRYGGGTVGRMVADDAADATLRLTPAD